MVVNDPHRRLENPSLRYYSHLNAPGWNVIGASEPPFVGVTAGHNDRVAWGYTFAGVDVNDVYVEELHPEQPDMVRWRDGWEPLRVITEEIPVKGEEPREVVLKYSRHGPVFYEDPDNGVVYAVRSITHEPGTAPYLGCFRMAQAESAEDFFERAMFWKVPTHNLVFGDVEGNIAFQVSALTPDREGWNGRLPVPGDGRYEWQGFREDLPREYNPQRGWVGTANNDSHPPDYTGRPVMFHSSRGVEYSRIERMKQLLQPNRKYTVDDHKRIQLDAYSLRAEADIPSFQGWTSDDAEVEQARALVADWNGVLNRDSAGAAVWYRWRGEAEAAAYDPETPDDERRPLVEAGLRKTVDRLKGGTGRGLGPVALRTPAEEPLHPSPVRCLLAASRGTVGRVRYYRRHVGELPAHPGHGRLGPVGLHHHTGPVGPARKSLLRQPAGDLGERRLSPVGVQQGGGGSTRGAYAHPVASLIGEGRLSPR